jgi:20S proteasome subunit beta 1
MYPFFGSLEQGEPPLVETAANIFRQLCYDYRDQLTAGIIVAGWDKRKGGQVINFGPFTMKI